jgi:murein DD-endopeptidase MepM/ murein hydrolase activator NlpD
MRIKSIFTLIFAGMLLGLFFISSPLQTNATEADDLQEKIEERNANIKQLEAEIKKYQAEVDKTSATAMTLASTIKSLQATGKKLDTDIKLTQNKISAASLTIQKLSGDISDKQQRINESRKAIGEQLRIMNQNDATPIIQDFLSKKNISKTWDNIQQLINLQTSLRGHVADLNGTKIELEVDKKMTEEKKNDLKEFSDTLVDQKKIVAANTSEKNTLLSETKNQEAIYQAQVKQRLEEKAALEKEIFDYESQLKYILDPSTIPSDGSAVFSWPTASTYITQQFGVTSASKRLYTSGSHNGTDFRAPVGTPVLALADGTVAGNGDTDLTCSRRSFGKWILVKHDNGLAATFGHLSVISVKEGQKVKRGDVIGYSGNTGYSTGPHLHISVYPNDAVNAEYRASSSCAGKTFYMPIAAVNAYLDPMQYFPKL